MHPHEHVYYKPRPESTVELCMYCSRFRFIEPFEPIVCIPAKPHRVIWTGLFGIENVREFLSRERAEQYADQCGISKTCRIEEV